MPTLYRPLELDSATPEVVKGIIRDVEARYLNEVHTLLRLPVTDAGLHSACNTSAFLTLASVIAGVSSVLHPREGYDGPKFKQLLQDYYPWQLGPVISFTPEAAAKIIYDYFRNPLVHDFGLGLRGQRDPSKLVLKRSVGLNNQHLNELEKSSSWPTFLKNPVLKKEESKITLSIEAFYWGVRSSIERLTRDAGVMSNAKNFLLPG